MKNMGLSGEQCKKIQSAIIDAFPTKSSLEQLLVFELNNKNLDAIAGGNNLEEIVFNLINVANARGWLEDLIRAAYESNSGNARLRDVAQELMPNYLEPPSNFLPSNASHLSGNSNAVPIRPPKQYNFSCEKTIELVKHSSLEESTSRHLKEETEILVLEKIFPDEHKYGGKLVILEIEIHKIVDPKTVRINLSISFGTIEVRIPQQNKILNFFKESVDIEFGIKKGELCLILTNASMPLNQRESLTNQDHNWIGTPIGEAKLPIWQFRLKDKTSTGHEAGILYGLLKNQILGTLEILNNNTYCELEAVFKISINRNYIDIIHLDNGNGKNKTQKETKIALLLNYLKTELEDCVSKVAIKYDPATIS